MPDEATQGRHIDPTENVRSLVDAGMTRQDDLRAMEADHLREIIKLARFPIELWAEPERVEAIVIDLIGQMLP